MIMKSDYKYSATYMTRQYSGDTIKNKKKFKSEPEAMTFVHDEKNIRLYGQITLSRSDAEGNKEYYNDSTNTWYSESEE